MSTITTFVDNQVVHVSMPGNKHTVANVLNFANTNVSAADVIHALKIPAGAFVDKVITRVVVAEGATCTATVGDGNSATGWDASINLNSAAATVLRSLEATDTYGVGKLYRTADTIDLVMGHNTDTAVLLVVAEYTMLDPYTLALCTA
jgi:hypothetical protein